MYVKAGWKIWTSSNSFSKYDKKLANNNESFLQGWNPPPPPPFWVTPLSEANLKNYPPLSMQIDACELYETL